VQNNWSTCHVKTWITELYRRTAHPHIQHLTTKERTSRSIHTPVKRYAPATTTTQNYNNFRLQISCLEPLWTGGWWGGYISCCCCLLRPIAHAFRRLLLLLQLLLLMRLLLLLWHRPVARGKNKGNPSTLLSSTRTLHLSHFRRCGFKQWTAPLLLPMLPLLVY
jgi:hypothetical protein